MLNAGEPVLVCPYNKAHSIIKSRMQFHLVKCRLQSPNSEKVVCPFDSTHVVPKVELEFHQQICENRIVIDSFLYDVGSSKCPVEDVPADVPPEALAPCEEDWDADPAVSVLDVIKEGAKERKVLLNLIGAPKAERKAHRVQERLRFQRVVDAKETEKGTEKKNKESRQKNCAQTSKKEVSSGILDNSTQDKSSQKSQDDQVEDSSQISDLMMKTDAIYSHWTLKVSNVPESPSKEDSNTDINKNDNDDFEVVKAHKKGQGKKNKKSQQQVRRPPPQNAPISKENGELNHMTKLNNDRSENKECVQPEIAERRLPEMKIKKNAWEKPLNMGSRDEDRAHNSLVCPLDDFPSLPVSGRGRGLLKSFKA